MTSMTDSLLSRPMLVKGLHLGAMVSLGIMTGVASCMYVWIIPIIRQAPNTRTKTEQFKTTITLGGRYLQPFSRGIAITLASMAYLVSQHQSPAVASVWKYYAAAMGVLVPIGPYEILTVFPSNDRILELGEKLRLAGGDDFKDERDREVDSLLTKWRQWHTGRIVLPFIATLILAWAVTDLLPL